MAKENIAKKSYREMYDELQVIITAMQQDDSDIDVSIKAYERGIQLVNELTEYLQKAENKIEELKLKLPAE